MRTHFVLTASVVLALSSPAALAFWSGHGGFEPDYPGDVDQGYMFADPDVDPNPNVQQVYFNAFMEPDALSVNPNSGTLQSRILTPDFQFAAAYLGVWKDCNNDGYIGSAESALLVYRSEILLDPRICPVDSVHNSGGWVYEFRWIGPADNALGPQSVGAPARMINDTAARVWGDIDLAGGDVRTNSCFVNPQTGTFSGSGGVLAYVDCNTGYAIAEAVTAADATGLLAFDDPRRPQCSSSLLNVRQNVFADDPKCPNGQPGLVEDQTEGEERAAFTTFDCANGEFQTVPAGPLDQDVMVEGVGTFNPADDEGNLAVVFVPGLAADPAADPTGSYYEAGDNVWRNTADECDANGGGLFYTTPESAVTSDSAFKRETDYVMSFEGYGAVNIGATFADIFLDIFQPGLIASFLGEAPPDGGQGILFDTQGLRSAPMWSSTSGSTVDPYLVRGDLQPAGPQYYTFYARVTDSAALTLPGNDGFYANEWCIDPEAALALGFDCDAQNWWNQEMGASAMPTEIWSQREIGQVPGALYNLRDIDCYDGTVTSLVPEARGLGLGLTLLSETEPPCAYYVPPVE